MSNRTFGNVTGVPAALYEQFFAWVAFWGNPASPTVRESHNVSSVTKDSTGLFTVTFSRALAATAYAVCIGAPRVDTLTTGLKACLSGTTIPTSTSIQIKTQNPIGDAQTDADVMSVGVVGYV